MRSLMPWMGMPNLKQEMERLFDRVAGNSSSLNSATQDAVMVKAEVPGMDPKDIQISLQEQLLTIKGEKQMEKEEKEERYYRMERTYGAFTRSVRLPVAVDGGKVSASFKNGLLTVTLPKTPAAKGTTIPIKVE